jgi:hypothetical protein
MNKTDVRHNKLVAGSTVVWYCSIPAADNPDHCDLAVCNWVGALPADEQAVAVVGQAEAADDLVAVADVTAAVEGAAVVAADAMVAVMDVAVAGTDAAAAATVVAVAGTDAAAAATVVAVRVMAWTVAATAGREVAVPV